MIWHDLANQPTHPLKHPPIGGGVYIYMYTTVVIFYTYAKACDHIKAFVISNILFIIFLFDIIGIDKQAKKVKSPGVDSATASWVDREIIITQYSK